MMTAALVEAAASLGSSKLASVTGASTGSGSKKRDSVELPLPEDMARGGGSSGSGAGPLKRARAELQLERCKDIIRRFHARGDVMPRHQKRVTPGSSSGGGTAKKKGVVEGGADMAQEHQDAARLKLWKQKQALGRREGQQGGELAEVHALLDRHMPLWRDPTLRTAHEIAKRCAQRGGVLPREWRDRKNCPVREQEYQDANKLKHWKQAVR
jgi:hypothetical protein